MASTIPTVLASYYSSTFTSGYGSTIGTYIDQLVTLNYELLGNNTILFWNYLSLLATSDNSDQVTADMVLLYNSVDLEDKAALEEGYAVILNKYTSEYLIQQTQPFVVETCEAFGIDPSQLVNPYKQ